METTKNSISFEGKKLSIQKRLLIVLGVIVTIGVFMRFINFPHNRSLLTKNKVEMQPAGLPIVMNDSLIRPLTTLLNSSLQKDLDGIIASNKKWAALASQKKMCIGLVDLRDSYNVRFARARTRAAVAT